LTFRSRSNRKSELKDRYNSKHIWLIFPILGKGITLRSNQNTFDFQVNRSISAVFAGSQSLSPMLKDREGILNAL
jgi:hypothetical protein